MSRLSADAGRRPRRPHSRIGVAVTVYLTVFIAMLDVSVVVLAQPSIQISLTASPGEVQWVIASYTLCLSVLSISVGALSDRYGRKRLFQLGLGTFTLGSAVCATAATPTWLIIGRFVQGTGAAIVVPGSLALIARTFTDPARQARLIAGWSTTAGVAALSGPLIGGLLVDGFGWQSIFLINLPLGAIALVVAGRSIREQSSPEHADLDPGGQLLGVGWLGALSYGLINAGEYGWGAPSTIVPLVLAAAILPIFLLIESRQPRPMLPIGSFANPRFSIPVVATFTLGFSLLALGVFLPAYLQQAQHHTAAQTGLIMLPPAAVAIAVPLLTGRWGARIGPRVPLLIGLLVVAAAAFSLLALSPGSSGLLAVACMAAMNIGYGLAFPASNAAVLAAVDPHRTGTVAATVSAVRQSGTTLGIAALGGIIAAHLSNPGGRTYEEAYTAGLHATAITAGIVALLTAALILLDNEIRKRRTAERTCVRSRRSSTTVIKRGGLHRPASPVRR